MNHIRICERRKEPDPSTNTSPRIIRGHKPKLHELVAEQLEQNRAAEKKADTERQNVEQAFLLWFGICMGAAIVALAFIT